MKMVAVCCAILTADLLYQLATLRGGGGLQGDAEEELDGLVQQLSCPKVEAWLESLRTAPWIEIDPQERPLNHDLPGDDDDPLLGAPLPHRASGANCTRFNSCFDIFRLDPHQGRMKVYVVPPKGHFRLTSGGREVAPLTRDFVDVLEAILTSRYHTLDPREATLFVPALDLLAVPPWPDGEEDLQSAALAKALEVSAGPHWNGGANNLLMSFRPLGGAVALTENKAVRATSGLTDLEYRPGFDVSIPHYSLVQEIPAEPGETRPILAVAPFLDLAPADAAKTFLDLMPSDRLLGLVACRPEPSLNGGDSRQRRCLSDRFGRPGQQQEVAYPAVLGKATFCVIMDLASADGGRSLMESLHWGCIPAVVADSHVLPFSEVLDWTRFSLRFYRRDVDQLAQVLGEVSPRRIQELRTQLSFVYAAYMADMGKIVRTTLDVVNDRLVPHRARTYRDWNLPPATSREPNPLGTLRHRGPSPYLQVLRQSSQPLPPGEGPRQDGFTAVVLTYNRVASLFRVIRMLSEAPSLARVVVVWNNQGLAPPPAREWPKIPQVLRVIKSQSNRLSNRFYPYDEVTTEAVLSVDDDIHMLTVDELEFGYQVWREFPDQLVGFPSRWHRWDNATASWGYESDWRSHSSMVLTGAAFYHKYWHYVYTAAPSPGAKAVKDWVDERMNCEDLAMNFLIANATGKPAIKVAARKKFKCPNPDCVNNEVLSMKSEHMAERSACLDFFSRAYGYMPLRSVEFRADPVLFKERMPDKFKLFSEVGAL